MLFTGSVIGNRFKGRVDILDKGAAQLMTNRTSALLSQIILLPHTSNNSGVSSWSQTHLCLPLHSQTRTANVICQQDPGSHRSPLVVLPGGGHYLKPLNEKQKFPRGSADRQINRCPQPESPTLRLREEDADGKKEEVLRYNNSTISVH